MGSVPFLYLFYFVLCYLWNFLSINSRTKVCGDFNIAHQEIDLKNLGILKERLAKGEITKKEYDELKKELSPKDKLK